MSDWVGITVRTAVRDRLRAEAEVAGMTLGRYVDERLTENEALRARIAELEAENTVLRLSPRQLSAVIDLRHGVAAGGPVTSASRWLGKPPFPKDAA